MDVEKVIFISDNFVHTYLCVCKSCVNVNKKLRFQTLRSNYLASLHKVVLIHPLLLADKLNDHKTPRMHPLYEELISSSYKYLDIPRWRFGSCNKLNSLSNPGLHHTLLALFGGGHLLTPCNLHLLDRNGYWHQSSPT